MYGPTHIKENVTVGTIVISVRARFVFLVHVVRPSTVPRSQRVYLCISMNNDNDNNNNNINYNDNDNNSYHDSNKDGNK